MSKIDTKKLASHKINTIVIGQAIWHWYMKIYLHLYKNVFIYCQCNYIAFTCYLLFFYIYYILFYATPDTAMGSVCSMFRIEYLLCLGGSKESSQGQRHFPTFNEMPFLLYYLPVPLNFLMKYFEIIRLFFKNHNYS